MQRDLVPQGTPKRGSTLLERIGAVARAACACLVCSLAASPALAAPLPAAATATDADALPLPATLPPPELDAGPVRLRFDVGAFTGLTAFSSKSGLGNAASPDVVPGTSVVVGVHAGAVVFERVAIEAEFRDALTSLGGGAGAAQVLGLHGQALWYFKTDGGVRPFALAGAGMDWLVTENKPCGNTKPPAKGCIFVRSPDDDFAFFFGGGARIPLTHRIALRGEARWLLMDGRPSTPKAPQDRFVHNAEIHFGAVVALGGRPADEDKDGVPDELDKCVTQGEDRDGYQDQDGCPDADNDNDGIEDDRDGCANDPEDMDTFEDADGCPDPDNDKDGVLDGADKCRDVAEDKDGIDDADGCPDLDDDGDGLDNDKDKCPKQKEDKDGFQDQDGCPDPDNDMDGIIDASDRCPDKAETPNGLDDDDGCPDQLGEAVARLFGGPVPGLEWKGAQLLKTSEAVLEPLLELMLEHDNLKVEVTVAADAEGEPGRKVAEQRVKVLRAWLEERGIEGTRLVTQAGPVAPQVVGATPPAKGVSRPAVTLRLLGK